VIIFIILKSWKDLEGKQWEKKELQTLKYEIKMYNLILSKKNSNYLFSLQVPPEWFLNN
tara:strand:- start:682 stop:858 length:177 start_codon:yes stop_codon:yes gene_type:complete